MALVTNFNAVVLLVFGVVWLALVIYLRVGRAKSAVYLLFFSIFYFYLYKVLDYTLIQFQGLVLLKYVSPELILNGFPAGEELNMVPLVTLTRDDWETSLLNVLLFVPFGFGLPFLKPYGTVKTVVIGMLFSIAIEVMQFTSGRIGGVAFRVADINDVFFNTAGAAVGYLFFAGFVRLCRRVSGDWRASTNPMWQYIMGRPQVR